jgi:molecular chaperone GrpE (heat shock protein)
MAFSKNLEECGYLYSTKYRENAFQGKAFSKDSDCVVWATDALRVLDDNIGRILTSSVQSSKELKQKDNTRKAEKTRTLDTILRIHDPKLTDKLNRFAEDRRVNDSAMLERIQQLQVSLQDELKQIMAIREGIDYNITQEAISQFVSLFYLLSETLQYHPDDESKDSYHNLVESCEDFLENIKQSLAMLGVTIINDVSKPFDPEKHIAAHGFKAIRNGVITKVVKIGFAYKNKVLEKAEVELA